MKNPNFHIPLAILAALPLLFSCLAVETLSPEEGPGDREIRVSTPVVSPSTKAASGEIGINYDINESFGVYGLYYQSGSFTSWKTVPSGDSDYPDGSQIYIDGAEFLYDGSIDDTSSSTDPNGGSGAWSANPSYYWPKYGKLAFAAWSPYRAKDDCSLSYDDDGFHFSDFTTSYDGSSHYDLMYSDRVVDKTASVGTSAIYDGIDLQFHHILSSVKFLSKAGSASTKIRVSKIVVYDIVRKADFNMPSWTITTMSSTDPGYDTYYYTESNPLVVYLDDTITEENVLSTSAYKETGFVLPIPQDISSAKFKVYYSVQLGSADPVPTVSSPINLGGQTISSGEGAGTALNEWKKSTRYTYSLVLGLQQIKFNVSIENWKDSTEKDISE
ncbi:MAG: fimbrillin family protein [Candidatus Cryptobacteroides sp.]